MEKKIRILTLSLIFSGAINVALIGSFAFFNVKEDKISFTGSRSKVDLKLQKTNNQLVSTMSRQSFRELVSFLTNKELVEEGYTKRDLALATLVDVHYFNLEKAISSSPSQVRTLQVSENQTIDVYPGLTEEQFEAIIRYAYQEKWPLSTQGLFCLLQKKGNQSDDSLIQAFFHSPEFYAFQMLFQTTAAPQESITLLNLITEGSWELLEKWAGTELQVVDFLGDKKRELLLSYFAHHSPTAAQLLLSTDFDFALKKLDDRSVLDLLSMLKKQTKLGTQFCVELLRSARKDQIREAAAMTLYSYVGEMPVAPIDLKEVLVRFDSQKSLQIKVERPALKVESAPSLFHIVKEGESLWKISRQYKVKVDDLVKVNGLDKDSLFPGMTLKIP